MLNFLKTLTGDEIVGILFWIPMMMVIIAVLACMPTETTGWYVPFVGQLPK